MSAIGRLRLLFIQPLEEEENGRDARAVKFFPPLQSSTRFRHESLWIGLDANCRSNPYLPSTNPIPSADSHTGTILGSCPFRSDHIHISLRHSPFCQLRTLHTTHHPLALPVHYSASPIHGIRDSNSITIRSSHSKEFIGALGITLINSQLSSLHLPRYQPGEVSSILVSSYHITSLPSSYYAAKSLC